jgi:tRNA(His) guanylyltransferase
MICSSRRRDVRKVLISKWSCVLHLPLLSNTFATQSQCNIELEGRRTSYWSYVKKYEMLHTDVLMSNVWIVIRVDGKKFSHFTKVHAYEKPIDRNAIELMNLSARNVMKTFPEVCMAYGQSDEFSFLLDRNTELLNRRSSKLNSCFASLFASNFVMHWNQIFNSKKPLQYAPAFDSRCIQFPTLAATKDYFRWRQDDAFVNHLYNMCFWYLVQKKGKTIKEAEYMLSGTSIQAKNELLFNTFGINIAKEPDIDKKGTVLLRSNLLLDSNDSTKNDIQQLHIDFFGRHFWESPYASHINMLEAKCTSDAR